MRLSARLLLLVGLCLLPVVGVAVYTQETLREGRWDDLADRARERAELLNSSLDQMVSATRDLVTAMAQMPALQASASACEAQLAELKTLLPRYRWFAVLDQHGGTSCRVGLDGELPPLAGIRASVQADDTEFWTGEYMAAPGQAIGVLPFYLRFRARTSGSLVIVAALDLNWLAGELSESLDCCKYRGDEHRTILVSDRNGTVLFRYPDLERWIGRQVLQTSVGLINAAKPGTTRVTGFDGKERIVGYVPTTQEPLGLFVGAGLYAPDTIGLIDTVFWRGGLFLALSAIAALVLAWVLGRRWIDRPTRLLIETAKRWRTGDLDARAPAIKAEFGLLAATFNDLAGEVKKREEELTHHALLLESRVSERTRALAETNNRLQVEIAEREKTEAALHRAQKLQAVGQLAGGIAHEFNNMLATVLGNLELLERRLPEDDSRLQQWVARAIGAVQRGAQLTSRLLAFSRRQRLTTGPTDFNALISDLAALVMSTLGRCIDVRTSLAPDLWLATADRSQVEAGILNVALNARDAMPDGGMLTLSTGNETIQSGQREDLEPGHYVRISITDTGEGMAPEVVARAAEPFFTTKGPGASGLGLSQAFGMARQSGGALRIASSPGHGTTVSLLFPRAAAPTYVPASGRGSGGELSRLSVLLVDDDADVRQVTSGMLAEMGCLVTDFADGPATLDTLAGTDFRFDLAVLDYAMPKMTGIELATALRTLGRPMPIVLATGYAEFADAAEGLLAAVIRKPFTLLQLEDVLRSALSGRPSLRVARSGQEVSVGLG